MSHPPCMHDLFMIIKYMFMGPITCFLLCLNIEGCKNFKVYQNVVTMSPFFGLFYHVKHTFMDDYDGVYNCNNFKYSPSENFDNF